jgi:hypothetical protein
MKKTLRLIFILFILIVIRNIHSTGSHSEIETYQTSPLILQQAALDANNINSWFINTGIFDQDKRFNNMPGFNWPRNLSSYAIFSCGLTTAALYNGCIRMASTMYSGEYAPGYIIDSASIPVAKTDSRFKFYRITGSDNMKNNPDWANWGNMAPFGAPYTDVNHNGYYESSIDTPEIKNTAQTIFLCMTDGFHQIHNSGEGFGGGTLPLYIESHLTAWCYDAPDLMNVQFIKWSIINKSHTVWTSAYFSITADPDLGCSEDDYIGCDTTRSLGFCYNGEDADCSSLIHYPGIVPAIGFLWLNCSGGHNSGMNSIDYCRC